MMKKDEDRKLIPIILTFVCLITIFLVPATASAVSVDFDFPFTNPGYGPIITVVDEFADKTALRDTVNVIITSNAERNNRISLELLETDIHSGEFKNTSLVLMDGDNLVPQDGTISIIYDELDRVDPVIVTVLSFFPPDFFALVERDAIELLLTQTSPGHYEGELKLTSTPNTDTDFEALAGDVIEIRWPCDVSDGLVIPNPDSTVGAIRVAKDEIGFVDDILTVTYDNGIDDIVTNTAEVHPGTACGKSGGGLVPTNVVLDVLAGGASGGDFAPPLLTISKLNLQNLPLVGDILDFILNADTFTPITPIDDPSIDYPVSINGNGYLLTHYANTIQTYTGKTGQPLSFKMTLFDATGIEHIALYTNLRDEARDVQDSDTFIIYHEEEPLQITDPNGFFSNVNFTESEYNGKYIAEFNMTFAKPMDTSDVIIRTWDELLNSGDIIVFDAIKIEGDQIVNPGMNNLIIPDSAEIVIPYYKLPYYEIPEADSEGNLIYYNSFGGLEERQVHPHEDPITYPDYLGKAERHDDGFYHNIINEETRAQTKAQTMIMDSFTLYDETKKDVKFYYPSNVGKLDRESKELLKDAFLKENFKAYKIFNKKYHSNHILD